MLELTSAGRPVQLAPGTAVQLEYNSPLFDEDAIKGQFSYSFAVPAGPNGPVYGFPERPDVAQPASAELPAELALDGVVLLRGSQVVRSATAGKYSVAVAGGLSALAAQLNARPLSDFAYGGIRKVPYLVNSGALDGGGNPIEVPGIVYHANAVVQSPEAYGYVFAPLRNDGIAVQPAGTTALPIIFPPALQYAILVNPWTYSTQSIAGLPPGGSFLYLGPPVYIPGQTAGYQGSSPGPMCPFPRLRYALVCIFREIGLRVDEANFLPGELGDLCLVTNALLTYRTGALVGTALEVGFSLADVMPAGTLGDLLTALRTDLGIVVSVHATTGVVSSTQLADAAATAATTDLTPHLAGTAEVTFGEAKGLTLDYSFDDQDELSKLFAGKQPAAGSVSPAVELVADLPAGAAAGEVRLVRQLDAYYKSLVTYPAPVAGAVAVPVQSWVYLCPNLATVAVAGGGEAVAQRLCYTPLVPTNHFNFGPAYATMRVPALHQPAYQATDAAATRNPAIRLLFYNGLQPTTPGAGSTAPTGEAYPQLSHTSRSGQLSVLLEGPAGTFAQALRAWYEVKLRPATVKVPLALTALDLLRLDFTRRVRLDGVEYLVRKLSVSVPVRKPAVAELVRCW